MALFRKKHFEELAQTEGKYCISIYVPTERHGENKESMVSFKNQIAEAEKQLENFGLKPREIEKYLDPVKALQSDTNLWRHLSDALIVFRSEGKFEYYTLPLEVKEFSLVSDRFYLLPLITVFNQNNSFFILSLSLNKNRLYEATQHEIWEIETEDILPGNIYDSVGHDVVQKALQMRGEQSGTGRADYPGKAQAMYHGRGEGKDDRQKEVFKYFEDLDRELNEMLKGYEIPLIIAATENVFAHFREISNYKNVYPEYVAGNFDEEDTHLLHDKASEILESYFEKVKNEKKEKYREAHGQTTTSLQDVVISADAGRIDTLFVEHGKHVWGDYKREEAKIDVHKEQKTIDTDLLDYSGRKTFETDGKVFIVDAENMPEEGSPVNAILRY